MGPARSILPPGRGRGCRALLNSYAVKTAYSVWGDTPAGGWSSGGFFAGYWQRAPSIVWHRIARLILIPVRVSTTSRFVETISCTA